MKKTTQSQSESIWRTKACSTGNKDSIETSTSSKRKVILLSDYPSKNPTPELKFNSISNFLSKWEETPEHAAGLSDARQWITESFLSDKDTIKSLRLKKGWSQSHLANEIASSQPHIARIERGTENVTIETCRKLCNALDVDMNTLNQALLNQEFNTKNKAK